MVKGTEGVKRKPVEPGKIEIEAVDMSTVINELGKNELISNNHASIESITVLDLEEGMTIPVQEGGNPNKEKDNTER